MSADSELVSVAASFAARAHLGQFRKDGRTPYFAHPARVCLIVATTFGVTHPEILASALLHDTIEDTTTDYDELVAEFGTNVATWVRALTKDKRLPEVEREEQYVAQLVLGPWQVHLVKLADIHDNLSDMRNVSVEKQARSAHRARYYLDRMVPRIASEARQAAEIVLKRLASVENS